LKDDALVEQIKRDYTEAALAPADRAMLDYVAKLTRTPGRMEEQDVVRLREAGFRDVAIVEINQITGFFAWCNRLVDGLGVELEDFWDEPGATNV
jgi:uncharacterized peroxidase-related enzyme